MWECEVERMGLLGEGAMRAACCSLVVVMLLAAVVVGEKHCGARVEHTKAFKSPNIKFRPGDVKNKFYAVEAPPGHFATVDFEAEMVYENGDSVPLSDVYLHHWIMMELAVPEGQAVPVGKELGEMMAMNPAHVYHGGAAVADGRPSIRPKQMWAKGGETRHLNSTIPAPYGLEGGFAPDGYRSQWVLNVHGIDTRGAANRMACTECRLVWNSFLFFATNIHQNGFDCSQTPLYEILSPIQVSQLRNWKH